MDGILSIIIFVIVSAILTIVLRGYDSALSFLLTIAAAVLLLLMLLPDIMGVVDSLEGVTSLISQGPFDVVVKAVGISVLSGLTSELCIDAGQRALASLVILAGKAAIIVSALPLLGELMEQVLGIVG